MSSSSSSTSTSAKRPRMVCKVCGDRALGFNFSALVCESCKSFFRRTAVAKDTLKLVANSDELERK